MPLPPGATRFGHCEVPILGRHGESAAELARRLLVWRELRPAIYGPSPLPDRIDLVPDTAPQAELHLVYDGDVLTLPALEAMVAAAASEGTVVLHARDSADARAADKLLARHRGPHRVEADDPPETIWLRDFAGHSVLTAEGPARIDFRYSVDCVVDDAWPQTLSPALRVPLWVEGGNLLTDGRTCYTTDVLALHNDLSTESAAARLRDLGCAQTVWLEPVPGTIEHVDAFLAVGDAGTVVLARISEALDPEVHAVLERNAAVLAHHAMVLRVDVEPARPLAPQLNVLPFNGVLMVPSLGSGPSREVISTLSAAFPGRRIALIPTDGLAELDGGPHCLAATVPTPR